MPDRRVFELLKELKQAGAIIQPQKRGKYEQQMTLCGNAYTEFPHMAWRLCGSVYITAQRIRHNRVSLCGNCVSAQAKHANNHAMNNQTGEIKACPGRA
jgi:hypothetical protein